MTIYGKPDWYFEHYEKVLGSTRDYQNEIATINQAISIENKRFLELGCGKGNHTLPILRARPKSYVGIDLEIDAIQVCQRKFSSHPAVQFIVGDAFSHRIENAPDIVSVFNSIALIKATPEIFHSRVKYFRSLLSSGGTLVLECVDPDVSKRIYPDGRPSLFRGADYEYSITSFYSDQTIRIVYRGNIAGENFHYEANLLSIKRDDLVHMHTAIYARVEIDNVEDEGRRFFLIATC